MQGKGVAGSPNDATCLQLTLNLDSIKCGAVGAIEAEVPDVRGELASDPPGLQGGHGYPEEKEKKAGIK